jgi:hypothetical protein
MNISLTSTNVQHYAEQLHAAILQENTLIFVHAHWCPYTVQFYPVWRAVKKTLYGNTTLRIYEIDDGAIGWIRQNKKQLYQRIGEQFYPDPQFKVFFPTVLMFVNGRRRKFTKERTQDNITTWISKLLATSRTRIRTVTKTRRVVPTIPKTPIKRPTQSKTPKKSLKESIDDAFKRLLLK